MEKVRLGFIGLWRKREAFKNSAEKNFNSGIKMVKSLCEDNGARLISKGFLACDPDEVKEQMQFLKVNNIDGLLLLVTSMIRGDSVLDIVHDADDMSIPTIIWTIPEPPGKMLKTIAFTGTNLCASIFRSYGVPYKTILGDVNDEESVQKPILNTIMALTVIKKFKNARIGLIGSGRVPGFYGSNFDEIGLKKRFGISIEWIDLSTVLKIADELQAEEVEKALNIIQKKGSSTVTHGELEKVVRIYLAMKAVAEEGSYSGLAVKCYPEFVENYGLAVCLCVAMLNEIGIATSDETDVLGLLSMMASNYATQMRGQATLMDIASYDESINAFAAWHCGASPPRLRRRGTETRFSRHFVMGKGVTCEELLDTGPVTVVRLVGLDGGKMFLLEGEIVNDTPCYKGACGYLQFPEHLKVKDVLNTILVYGVEHHYSVARSHHADILEEVAYWLKIEKIPLVDYEGGRGAFARR